MVKSGHVSFSSHSLKHLMILLKCNVFMISFYTLSRTLITCMAMQLRFLKVETLLNNDFNTVWYFGLTWSGQDNIPYHSAGGHSALVRRVQLLHRPITSSWRVAIRQQNIIKKSPASLAVKPGHHRHHSSGEHYLHRAVMANTCRPFSWAACRQNLKYCQKASINYRLKVF